MSNSDSSEGDNQVDNEPRSHNLDEPSDDIEHSGSDYTDIILPEEPLLFLKIYKLSIKNWYYIVLALNLVSTMVMIGSLATNRWVKQGKDNTRWEGGLIVCEKCDGQFEEEKYSDIADDVCGEDDLDGFCDLYEKLSAAGNVYFVLEIISIAIILVWSLRIVACFFGKALFKDWITYGISAMGCLVHTAGFIAWIIIADALYGQDCEDVSRSDFKPVCPTHGPGLAIAAILILAIDNLLFILIFSVRMKVQLNYMIETRKKEST